MSEAVLRRVFLQKCFSSVLKLGIVPVMIGSCRSKEDKTGDASSDPCTDLSELGEDDIKKRKDLGYVQKSPSASKYCGNCNLWLPPADKKSCGKCQLFKGPVPAEGYCTYWAPQV